MLTDKSASHLVSKHGHTFGINDQLPLAENQKPTQYTQIRTRINKENKAKFGDILEKIFNDPTTEVFPDITIRGAKGRGYFNSNYGPNGAFIGIVNDGPVNNQIIKAQPVSPRQLDLLQDIGVID